MTTYMIEAVNNGYRLEHYEGPYKCGLKTIPADGTSLLDEGGLVDALIDLRVPEGQRAIVLQEMRSQQTVKVTFDAKTNEPLSL